MKKVYFYGKVARFKLLGLYCFGQSKLGRQLPNWKSKNRKACPNCTKLKRGQWKQGRKDCHTSNVTLPYTMAWPAWKMSHSQLRTSIMANYTFSLPLLCSKRKNRKEKKKFSQHKHCTQKLALVQTWYNCASFGSFIFRKLSQKSLPICLQNWKKAT